MFSATSIFVVNINVVKIIFRARKAKLNRKKILEKNPEIKNKKTIFYAIGNSEILKIILEKDLNLEEKDKNLDTPLIMATRTGIMESVKTLVGKGAKLDVLDVQGSNLLDIAFGIGNDDLTNYYLDKGLSINTKNKDLLIWAIEKDKLKVVEEFYRKNPCFDYKDKTGKSLLMIAAIHNSKNVGEYLINKGLNVLERDKNGYTSLMYAAKYNSIDLGKLLLKKGTDYNEVMSVAVNSDSLEMLKIIDKKGAKLKLKDKNGMNYLMSASKNGALKVAKYLLDKGFNEDKKDKFGETALMYAVRANDINMAKLLIKEKANKKTENKKDESLLDASKSSEMRAFLIEQGLKW